MLPHSYQVNDRQRPINATPPRGELGLPDGGFVFASFNQTYKINPEVFDAWMEILRAVPQSVLWLLTKVDGDPAVANLRREAAGARRRRRAAGVRPASPQRRLPGALSPRRSVPRHVAVQRAHDGQRRAMGRMPGADFAGRHVRGSGSRKPPARGRAAGARDDVRIRLRRPRDCARGRRRGASQARGASRGPGARQPAVRHRAHHARAGAGLYDDGCAAPQAACASRCVQEV